MSLLGRDSIPCDDLRSLIDLRHATLHLGIRLARNDFLIRRIFNERLFKSFVTLVDDLDQELGCTRFLCWDGIQ